MKLAWETPVVDELDVKETAAAGFNIFDGIDFSS